MRSCNTSHPWALRYNSSVSLATLRSLKSLGRESVSSLVVVVIAPPSMLLLLVASVTELRGGNLENIAATMAKLMRYKIHRANIGFNHARDFI